MDLPTMGGIGSPGQNISIMSRQKVGGRIGGGREWEKVPHSLLSSRRERKKERTVLMY
jgi:hypothetical protein